MIPNFSIIKKLFGYKTFEIGDYSYDFISIGQEKNYVTFEVNCTLPQKNSSYILDKMKYDVDSIILENFNFLGQSFSYSTEILVDGEKPRNAYINLKKYSEAIQALDKNLSKISFFDDSLKLKLSYEFPKNFIWVRESESVVDLDVFVHIEKIVWENRPVTIYENRVNNFGAMILNFMYDEYEWSQKVDDVIYQTWEDELQVEKTNIYFQTSLILYKILGEISGNGEVPEIFNPSEFFNEIS